MTPIRRGDGSSLQANGFSEIRKGDGTVLWKAQTFYYDEGDENTSLTGGWVIEDDGPNDGTFSSSKNSDNLSMSQDITSGDEEWGWFTSDKVNVTDIDTLKIDWEYQVDRIDGSGIRARYALTSDRQVNPTLVDLLSFGPDGFNRRTDSLDVSSETGDYHVAMLLNSFDGGDVTLRGYRMWGV